MESYWKDRKVLVTGGGGFIPSHLVERLLEEGARVRAFVRYNSRGDAGFLKEMKNDDRLEIVAGDLRDYDAVDQAVRGSEAVFHLGALISIPYSYLHPVEVVETNVNGTLNVLMACRKYDVEKMIHTSTSEVYGTAITVPISETHPLQGQSPYSASKIGADKLVESFYCAYSFPVVTVRPFNTFGPRQSARAVIPTIITQVLTKDVIRLGNLEAKRDFTYVADTVTGFLRAAEAENVFGEVFNLGTGVEVTIGQLADMIIDIAGRRVRIEVDPNRIRPAKSEVQRLLSDNLLARQRIGWQPVVSLEEGLQRTVDWIEKHLEFFNPNIYAF